VKVIYGLASPELRPRPRVVAVGAYDGVHRGHQMLLDVACEAAAIGGCESTALTFEPIPAEVVGRAGSRSLRLTLLDEKLELLEKQHIGTVVVVDFDEQFCNVRARDFARDILADRLGTHMLVASETHTFGRGAEADVRMMQQFGHEFGFEVHILPLFSGNGARSISSSHIRRLLWEGRVEHAAGLLGRPYSMRGTVVPGRGLGNQLGFPTANLQVPEAKLIPADGVYAAIACWENQPGALVSASGIRGAAAAVSIGVAPTFGPSQRLVEAHILDASPSLEGRSLELHFVSRLREQQKFPGAELLSVQIARDLEDVRQTLSIDN